MTVPRFLTSREAKEAGWFSRRHETSAAHIAAKSNWLATRGKTQRQIRAAQRNA